MMADHNCLRDLCDILEAGMRKPKKKRHLKKYLKRRALKK